MSEALRVPQQEKAYDKLPEAEQIERFRLLKAFIDGKSTYGDLWDNMYKYTEKMNMPGSSTEQKQALVREMVELNRLIRDGMGFYLEVKKHHTGAPNNLEGSYREFQASLEGRYPKHFVNPESLQLDVAKIKEAFDWGMQSAKIVGASVGREVKLDDQQMAQFRDDVGAILETVNRVR